jgi:hypothetical protein
MGAALPLLRRVERRAALLRREERFLDAVLRAALDPLRAILYFFVRF